MVDETTPIDAAIEAELGAVKPTAPLAPLGPIEPRVVQPIPIMLDRERHLRLDFRAMRMFETATGLNPWGSEAWANPGPGVMAHLIWAALLHEDPNLTIEDVEVLPGMDMANMAYLTDRLGMLWGATMPQPEPEPAVNGATSPNPRRTRAV